MEISLRREKPHNIFVSFLDLLKVKYTNDFSNKYFNEHPHKYNLFGLSKMLSEYNVDNAAIKVKDKEEALSELEVPFVAHLGGDFAVVTNTKADKIEYIVNGKDIKILRTDFLKIWTGVILLAETQENSKEPEYEKHIAQERIVFLKKTGLFILSVLLLSIIYTSQSILHTNIGFSILLLANIAGIYISYLLAQKQMKIQSSYTDKICSLFKQGDCNNILESDASRLLGILSWSEIGLGYFVSNTLILLFSPHLISYLALINICALPYSLWSIWYQKFKAGQWCPLCLIVQALLWMIFVINIISGFISVPVFKTSEFLLTGCLYMIPIIAANLLISSLTQSENIEQIKQEINSIKSTDEVFVSLLKKQAYYKVTKDTSRILFGNPGANILITVLTNPHCNPCAKMHKRIEKVLAECKDNLCIQYIFSSFDQSLDSSNQFLIWAYISKPDEKEHIINNWFEKGKNDKDSFLRSYGWENTKEVLEEFNNHENWKNETGLRSTPTILINGYKLPDNYKIEDIRYFTDLVIDTR